MGELTLKEIPTEDENGERNTDIGIILGHDASDFMSISSADSFLEFTEDLEILFSDDDERLHDEGKMVAELIGEEENSVLCQTLDGKIGTCVTDKDCSTFTDANSEECGVLSATNKLYCCVHSARCDQLSSELVTYMYNEGYPDVSQNEDGCPISINILPGLEKNVVSGTLTVQEQLRVERFLWRVLENLGLVLGQMLRHVVLDITSIMQYVRCRNKSDCWGLTQVSAMVVVKIGK